MRSAIFTAYITKYALSTGIKAIKAQICSEISKQMIADVNNTMSFYHDEGKDWHFTKADAVERAEKMRDDKIESLHKQSEKIRKLNFQAQVDAL